MNDPAAGAPPGHGTFTERSPATRATREGPDSAVALRDDIVPPETLEAHGGGPGCRSGYEVRDTQYFGCRHSRSVIAGGTRAARLDGTYDARSATAPSSTNTVTYVIGSDALTS